MKNITVTIDDDLYRIARIKAAEAGTTVTGLVRTYLAALSQSEDPIDLHERTLKLQDELFAAIDARGAGLRPADRLPREELYRRDAFR